MKKNKRIIAIALTLLIAIGALSACSAQHLEIINPEDVASQDYADGTISIAAEIVPLAGSPANSIPMPAAPRTSIKTNAKAEIDYSNTGDGYVMARFIQDTTKQLRVIVKGPSDVQYQYRLNANKQFEVFPLSDGSGSYTITVYEQTEGSKYATALSLTTSVTLRDPLAPFLRPNQYVNYTTSSAAVTKAAELVNGKTSVHDKVAAIYEYITTNLTYDRDFAAQVAQGQHAGYVPNVDTVLANKKGICFDFAALMTAMLRSQGVPTRLVIGYASTAYHAWLEVWTEDGGWTVSIYTLDGRVWNLMDPTFGSSARTPAQAAELARLIGDGSSYSPRYLY